jgi:hypothetical protein
VPKLQVREKAGFWSSNGNILGAFRRRIARRCWDRYFVKGTALFAVHALIILLLLFYFVAYRKRGEGCSRYGKLAVFLRLQ